MNANERAIRRVDLQEIIRHEQRKLDQWEPMMASYQSLTNGARKAIADAEAELAELNTITIQVKMTREQLECASAQWIAYPSTLGGQAFDAVVRAVHEAAKSL
jgi:hypothetical protein